MTNRRQSKIRAGSGRRRPAGGVAAAIYVTIGLIFLGIGSFILVSQDLDSDEVEVDGLIVGFAERDRFDDNDGEQKPIIEYVDPASGTTHRFQSKTWVVGDDIGNTVSVAFDARRPSEARRVGEEWLGWLLIAVGVAAFPWAIVSLVRGRRFGVTEAP